MSTPYTMMRSRMKDLISCFNACKLPVEKDDDESDHRKATASSVIDNRSSERGKKLKVGTTSARSGGGGVGESSASWRSRESEEDDYIVFYFKDDDDDTGRDVIEERGVEAGCSNPRKKETYQESTERVRVDAKRNEAVLEELGHTLSESSESSAGSFAFPTIQREWTGSPVLMPRPEGHKSGGACVQCCKF